VAPNTTASSVTTALNAAERFFRVFEIIEYHFPIEAFHNI
jgi:hypothetical protein